MRALAFCAALLAGAAELALLWGIYQLVLALQIWRMPKLQALPLLIVGVAALATMLYLARLCFEYAFRPASTAQEVTNDQSVPA